MKNLESRASLTIHALELQTQHDKNTVILDPDDTIRIRRLRLTGKKVLKTVYVGESSHTYELNDAEYYTHKTTTLDELIHAYEKHAAKQERRGYKDPYDTKVDPSIMEQNESYQQWIAELPSQQDWLDAARDLVATREMHEDDQMPCDRCKGAGERYQDCVCKWLISSITNFDGISVSDREDGTPDPQCKDCHGTGGGIWACGDCDGVGHIDLYPQIQIYEPTADQTYTIRIDIAQLITESPEYLRAKTHAWSVNSAVNYWLSEYVTQFNMSDALAKRAGIRRSDDEVVHIQFAEDYKYMREYDEFFSREQMQRESWRSNEQQSAHRQPTEIKDVRKSLETYQRILARHHHSRARQWDGLSYRILYAPTAERRFVDLRNALGEKGLSLAIRNEFIGTGETGPSLNIARGDEMIAHLDQEYSIDRAVEGAWQEYLKLAPTL